MSDVESRFWSKVAVNETSGCWEWTASLQAMGYGQFRCKPHTFLAHRVSWQLAHGSIPDGLWVLHHCDNRRCVNPSHLFLGTQVENMADMRAKGRQSRHRRPRGEANASARLAASDVVEIRRLREEGLSYGQLAARFGVDQAHIGRIVRREAWAHI